MKPCEHEGVISSVSLRFDKVNNEYREYGVRCFSILNVSVIVWYVNKLNNVSMVRSLNRGLLFSLEKKSVPKIWLPKGRHLALVRNFSR